MGSNPTTTTNRVFGEKDIISRFEREVVGSIPARPTNKEIKMKPVKFKIIRTGETVLCPDLRAVQVIEDIEYLTVRKLNSEREFLMRREALVRVEKEK